MPMLTTSELDILSGELVKHKSIRVCEYCVTRRFSDQLSQTINIHNIQEVGRVSIDTAGCPAEGLLKKIGK